jgi:hypothetical protein
MAIDEGTGEATPRTLEWSGDQIVEREAGRTTRTFEVRNGAIVRIDWGGATSILLEDAGADEWGDIVALDWSNRRLSWSNYSGREPHPARLTASFTSAFEIRRAAFAECRHARDWSIDGIHRQYVWTSPRRALMGSEARGRRRVSLPAKR